MNWSGLHDRRLHVRDITCRIQLQAKRAVQLISVVRICVQPLTD